LGAHRSCPSRAGGAPGGRTAWPPSPREEDRIPLPAAAALFVYAILSNVALAVIPHEPVVLWYGAHHGVWLTALVATAGTVAAAWVDHSVFVPLIRRVAHTPLFAEGTVGWLRARFARAPFVILTVSGITPLPFFPFKAMAFAERYPLGPYLAAVAAGRFPRYLLLAWLGIVIQIPTWLLVVLFAVMLLPSLRLLWTRHSAK
jgi:membrane protein YqaA with SNARE-associated domain